MNVRVARCLRVAFALFKICMVIITSFFFLWDWIWPTLEPELSPIKLFRFLRMVIGRKSRFKRRESRSVVVDAWEEKVLALYLSSLTRAEDAEFDRAKTTNGKLQGVLTFSEVIVTIILALLTLLFDRKLNVPPLATKVIGLFLSYIALQFVRIIFASKSALYPKSFKYKHLEKDTPGLSDTESSFLHKECDGLSMRIYENRLVTDEKISQLRICHTAVRNIACALLIAVLLGLLYFSWSSLVLLQRKLDFFMFFFHAAFLSNFWFCFFLSNYA